MKVRLSVRLSSGLVRRQQTLSVVVKRELSLQTKLCIYPSILSSKPHPWSISLVYDGKNEIETIGSHESRS